MPLFAYHYFSLRFEFSSERETINHNTRSIFILATFAVVGDNSDGDSLVTVNASLVV